MPPGQHPDSAEPSPASSPGWPEDPAADGSRFMPGVFREPASRVQIRPQVMRIGRHPGNDIIAIGPATFRPVTDPAHLSRI